MRIDDFYMKKLIIILLFLSLLTACSTVKNSIEETITNKVNEELDLESDEDYQEYKKMVDNDELTENGIKKDERYAFIIENVNVEDLGTNEIETFGSTHVSFVKNSIMSISYYNDENHTELLGNDCYLNPGDTIYASVPKITPTIDSIYEFDGFRIFGIDSANNTKNKIKEINEYHIVIPETDTNDISVEPFGHFKDVSLTLYDYYLDGTGKENDLPGVWTINGEKYQEKTVNIGKTTSYSVLYEYDDSEYYVSLTSPEALYKDKGIVSFENGSPKTNNDYYLVELSKYASLSISGNSNKGIDTVKINGKQEDIENLQTIKCGDRIEITTNNKYKIINRVLNLETNPETLNSGGTRYSFVVPEGTYGNITIEVSDKVNEYLAKEIKNGKVEVKLKSNGKEVEAKSDIGDNEEIIVKIIPNTGYYVSGNDVSENVYEKAMKYSEYKKKIDGIISSHECIKYTKIIFDTSDDYGVVTYKVDGNEVNKESLMLRRDQKIKMDYRITNKEFEIKKTGLAILSDKGSASIDIKVSDLSNGTVLKRESYIQIGKKGS